MCLINFIYILKITVAFKVLTMEIGRDQGCVFMASSRRLLDLYRRALQQNENGALQ